jgi:cytochrome c oxidase subunit 1
MNATEHLQAPQQFVQHEPPKNYLTEERTLRGWLLTTDHKRIGLLYLFSIIFYFAIAAVAAAMMRIELLTPVGDLVTSETYNRLFTIHGTLMVWFFLIPSIPAVLGNFVLPMMIGARDVAFPRLNLFSWYLFCKAPRGFVRFDKGPVLLWPQAGNCKRAPFLTH